MWHQQNQSRLYVLSDTSFPKVWSQFVIGCLCFRYSRLSSLSLQVKRWVWRWVYLHCIWVHGRSWTWRDTVTSTCQLEIKTVIKDMWLPQKVLCKHGQLVSGLKEVSSWSVLLEYVDRRIHCHCPWHSWHCIMLNEIMFYTERIMF